MTDKWLTNNFKNDWVSYLGNSMSTHQRDMFIKEMEDIINNPKSSLRN